MTTDIETMKVLGKLGNGDHSVQSLSLLPDGESAIVTSLGQYCPLLVNLNTSHVKRIGSLSSIDQTNKDGSGNDMTFKIVNHLTPLPDGRIVMNDRYTLRSLTQDGDGVISVETIAGSDEIKGYADGQASKAIFDFISYLAHNPVDGSIIIVDKYRIRKLSKDGMVSTLAGTGNRRIPFDPYYVALPDDFDVVLPALEFSFSVIKGVAVLSDGTILVADCEKLRQISVDGMVSTIANFDHYMDGLLVDGDDNIYTCVGRFEDENDDYDPHNPKRSTAVVKINAVTKTVVDVVRFGSQIDRGRLISFTKEGHLMVAGCSGICHIVKTSCRMVQNKIQEKEEEEEEEQVVVKEVIKRRSNRLAVLREERVATRRRRSQRLATLRDSCV